MRTDRSRQCLILFRIRSWMNLTSIRPDVFVCLFCLACLKSEPINPPLPVPAKAGNYYMQGIRTHDKRGQGSTTACNDF